jgi:hypothetical protein
MNNTVNPRLYSALIDRFGDVGIHNRGAVGQYTCPPTKHSFLKRVHKETKFAHVVNWGETYSVCCPVCNDRKKRLYISHFTGRGTKVADSKYQFGNVAVCHNEKCDLRDTLREIKTAAEEYTDIQVEEINARSRVKYMNFVRSDIDLPVSYPLLSSIVPHHVHKYLGDRGFIPTDLSRDHELRFLPTGSELWKMEDGTVVKTYEDRVLIPVVQGLIVKGWQARVVDPKYTGNKKYMFPPAAAVGGGSKQQWLYNMDVAKFHTDMVICEGVTDVWKVGPSAVCTFGKHLSEDQLHILKLLWGYKGSCVICADPDAVDKWQEQAQMLRERKVFPKGVVVIPFPAGYDPGDYTTDALTGMIANWRTTCHN